MTANYQAIRERSARAVDAVMAESILLAPMSDEYADPSRVKIEFKAVLRTGGAKNTSLNGGMGRDWVSRIVAGRAQLHIDRAANTALVCKRGDKIQALDRPGQPIFEILDIDDRGHTRLVIDLGEA